ncbi:homeobox and C2H2 transcription factor [Halenospora varia]|nr:homeobox and C2H2 transcription factor [Halenospora varia]
MLDSPAALDNFTPADQDFLNLIDGAHRPPNPCSYCRYNRLECLIIRTTLANPNPISACSSCVALFRECSLAIGEKRKPSDFETNEPILGHLHGVNEESSPEEQKNLASPPHNFESKGKRAISKQDIRLLKAWLSEHRNTPYPSHEEKLELRATTGLTLIQISNWFANARRRNRQFNSIPAPSIPIPRVPVSSDKKNIQETTDLSPLARWQNSPPEEDSVDLAAVAQALKSQSHTYQAAQISREDTGRRSSFDATSISNYETSISGMSSSSLDSSNSAWSYGSRNSHRFYTSLSLPKRRQLKKRANIKKANDTSPAIYQCTFCSESFKKKHDWQRHEKSIHLPLEYWICCSGDGTIKEPENGLISCIFCGIPSPTEAHLNWHEFNTCSSRPPFERTFRRKDHLRQHLIKYHQYPKPFGDVMEMWKVELSEIRSRCGICEARLQSWDERTTHLAKHFKEGAKMDDWIGGWGLEDDAAGLVQNVTRPGNQQELMA